MEKLVTYDNIFSLALILTIIITFLLKTKTKQDNKINKGFDLKQENGFFHLKQIYKTKSDLIIVPMIVSIGVILLTYILNAILSFKFPEYGTFSLFGKLNFNINYFDILLPSISSAISSYSVIFLNRYLIGFFLQLIIPFIFICILYKKDKKFKPLFIISLIIMIVGLLFQLSIYLISFRLLPNIFQNIQKILILFSILLKFAMLFNLTALYYIIFTKFASFLINDDSKKEYDYFTIKKFGIFYLFNILFFVFLDPQIYANIQQIFMDQYKEIQFFNSFFFMIIQLLIAFIYTFIIPLYLINDKDLKNSFNTFFSSFFRNHNKYLIIFITGIAIESLLIYINSTFANIISNNTFLGLISEMLITILIVITELEIRIHSLKLSFGKE